MEQILAQLADVGGPAFLLVLAFRFWAQFQNLLGLIGDAAEWTAAKMRTFASRAVVIITRKIWWVILPVMLVATVLSSISAWQIEGSLGWFSANLSLKLLALVSASVMAVMAGRVRHIPDNATETTQADINAAYGRPWLFFPMIAVAMFSLIALTGATLSDTFMLADRVSYFHSVFSVVLFVLTLVFTTSFVMAGLVSVYVLARVGIDFGGGGWSGVAVPIATAIIPLLTRQNNQVITISPEDQARARETAWALLIDNRFAGGVVAAWILWFMNFHSPIAWLVELVIIITLVCVLLTVWWITKRPLAQWRDRITFTVAALGLICIFWRLIDAAVGPHSGEPDMPVLFYHRMGWLISALFGWDLPDMSLGCFVAGVPRASLLLVGLIAVVLGWLAKRKDGSHSRILLIVALLVGLPIVGIVTARAMTPDGYLCQTTSRTAVVATVESHASELPPSPPPSGMGPTVEAGSYPPRERTCTMVNGTPVPRCPGR
jgi:hypothetical protein